MKTPKALTLFQPLISEHKFSTYITVETESENLFSGWVQLERSTGTASLLVCQCLACLSTFCKQIVREASAAAKNRPTDV